MAGKLQPAKKLLIVIMGKMNFFKKLMEKIVFEKFISKKTLCFALSRDGNFKSLNGILGRKSFDAFDKDEIK